MKKIIIKKMDEKDKKQIRMWDRYAGKFVDGYERFIEYLGGKNVEAYVKSMDLINQKSNGEQATFSYVLKEKGKVKCFVYFLIYKDDRNLNNMYVQGIASDPLDQRKGHATRLLKMLLKNPEKYMCCRPALVSAIVDTQNKQSRGLFQKLEGKFILKRQFMYDEITVDLRCGADYYCADESSKKGSPHDNDEKINKGK